MPTFTYDIGYYGKAVIDNQGILATGGSISVEYSPLFTTGVWGADWVCATDKIAYAPNYVTLTGSVNYQLTKNIADKLITFAFTKRNQSKTCSILPNGVAGYTGPMWCTGVSFSTSQDSLVTGDISLKSGNVTTNGGTVYSGSQSSTARATAAFVSSISAGYRDVFPYWGSAVYLNKLVDASTRTTATNAPQGTKIDNILDWNASYSSQLIFAACCIGTSTMLQSNYCALGSMQAQGSFTMFGVGSYITPANIQKHNSAKISMKPASGDKGCKICYGALVWTGASTDVQTGNSLIQSSFNFSALGNTTQAPMILASNDTGV